MRITRSRLTSNRIGVHLLRCIRALVRLLTNLTHFRQVVCRHHTPRSNLLLPPPCENEGHEPQNGQCENDANDNTGDGAT